jgi:hypothetical protein
MSKVITLGGINPPDNSGTWFEDGWGGWTQDASLWTTYEAPKGYYIDDGWGGKGLLIPNEVSPSLNTETADNVNKAIGEAKSFEDTKVGRILSVVLDKGQSFLTLLKGFGVIKDVSQPISYGNIDKTKAKVLYDSGQLQQQTDFNITPPPAVNNSTYFGVDFSKPVTWLVIALLAFLLYKTLNTPPNAPQTIPQQTGKAKRFINT